MDLSTLSDEQLLELKAANGDLTKLSNATLMALSGRKPVDVQPNAGRNGAAAATEPDVPPQAPSVGERLDRQLNLGTRAVGRGVAGLIGAPVDLATAAINTVGSGINLAGRAVGRDPGIKPIHEPVGGSESIQNLFAGLANKLGVNMGPPPEAMTSAENLTGKVVENMTGFGLPAAYLAKMAGGAVRGGTAAAELNPIMRPYGEAIETSAKMAPGVAANYAAARPVLVDTAAGAGAGVGQHLAPETPLGQLFGTLAGGVGGATAFNVATAPYAGTKAVVNYLRPDKTVPGATTRIADMAGERIQGAAIDPAEAAINIRTKTQQYRDAGITEPTAGLLSEDPGLIGVEKGLRNSDLKLPGGSTVASNFARRDAQTRQGAADNLADIKPNANPRLATDFAERGVEAVRGAAQGKVTAAQSELDAVTALRNADAGTLGGNIGNEAGASTAIDRTVRGTLGEQRTQKNALYDEAKTAGENVPRGLEALTGAASEVKANVGKLNDPNAVAPVAIADRILTAAEKGDSVSYADIVKLRPELAAEIEKARQAGNGAMVESLVKLKGAIEGETKRIIDDAAKPGATAEVKLLAEKLAAADSNYQNVYKPNFVEGEGGKFRQDIARDTTGANTQPSQTAKRFLTTQESAADLKRIVELAGNPADAQKGVRDYLFGRVAAEAMSGDKIVETRLNKWLAQNKGIIDQYPQVAQEMRDLQTRVQKNKMQGSAAEAQLARAKQGLGMTEREIERSGLGLMLGKDPANAIEAVMKSGDPERAMASLVKQMGGKGADAPTAQAFKRAVADWVESKVTNQNPAATTEGSNPVSLAKLAKVDDRYDKALAQAFTPQEMSSLQMVRKAVTDLSRLSSVRSTAGSNTAEDIRAGMNLVELVAKGTQGVLKGGGTTRVARLMLSNLGLMNEGQAVGQVLSRAMHDPQLAAHLLERPVAKQDRALWNKQLNRLMGVSAMGREEGKE